MKVGHRGARVNARENTISGVNAAKAAGLDGIEVDFRASKDGILVCHHDRSLKRIYGLDMTISEHPFKELKDATLPFSDPLNSIGEILNAADGIQVSIELKDAGTEHLLIEELAKFPNAQIMDIASFNPEVLAGYRHLSGSIPLRYNISWKKMLTGVFTAKKLGASCVGLRTYNLYFPVNFFLARMLRLQISVDPINKKWQAKLAKFFHKEAVLIGDNPSQLKNW